MLTLLFAAAAVVHSAFLIDTFRRPAGAAEWLIRALLFGLVADNLILALAGTALGESWYVSVNEFRYLWHAFALPLLLPAGVLIAQRAGVEWAQRRGAIVAAYLLAGAGIAAGFVLEVAGIEFVQKTLFDHTRLVSANNAPPLVTIATNFLLVFVAAGIWRASGWRWLLAGAGFILVVNGATGAQAWGIIAGNLSEIVFALAWIATLRRFPPGYH